MIDDKLRIHREQLLLRHIEAENSNDTETALETFTRPTYDLRAVEGPLIEGSDMVRELIASFGTSMPAKHMRGTVEYDAAADSSAAPSLRA